MDEAEKFFTLEEFCLRKWDQLNKEIVFKTVIQPVQLPPPAPQKEPFLNFSRKNSLRNSKKFLRILTFEIYLFLYLVIL